MGIVQSTLRKKREKQIQEIDTLNKSIEFLGHHQKLVDKEIDSKKERVIRLENKIDECKSEYSKYISFDCKICFDNLIETILVPCGHCYCTNCSNNMQHCYICQQPIHMKYKIYKD